jgi:hypothetical protein
LEASSSTSGDAEYVLPPRALDGAPAWSRIIMRSITRTSA